MSFLARVSYTANGSTDTFSFSFPYILSSHVKVYVDGVEDTGVTFPTTSTVQLSSTPANGAVVLIQRTTPSDSRLVDFQDGSVLTSSDLDQSADQNFYIAQETNDNVASKLGEDASGRYDANNKRIINLANPVDTQDAVTKNYLENTWLSTANKTALTTVNANIANINAVNANEANINSVNSNEANINTVATNIGSVNTVATDIAKVITVANDLAEAVSEVETVADDLNEATSEIDTVASSISNVDTVGTNIANVNTVAGISSNVTTVAGISSDVTSVANDATDIGTVATNITNVNNVATDIANVNSVAGNSTNINAVAGNATNINAVNANSSNINTVAGINADVTTVANDGTDIGTVATNIANVNTVAGNNANITTVAGNDANITTVAGISSNVTTVANDQADIGTVATDISNVNTVAGSIANVNTVATNVSDVNNFADRYRVQAGEPSVDNDEGDLVYDTTANAVKVYNGTSFDTIQQGITDVAPTRHSIRPSLNLDFANSKVLDPRITFTRASNATYYDGYTSVKAEENLYSYSQEFDNASWSKSAVTVTTNDTTAPDGTTTADLIIPTTATTNHWIAQSITLPDNTYVISVFAKAGGYNWLKIFGNSGESSANFDLSTGSLGTNGGTKFVSASIQDVGNGWYRCSMVRSGAFSSTNVGFYALSAEGNPPTSGNTETGDGTSGVYLWGGQIEKRSSATAYTPTTSSPITKYQPALQTAGNNVARFDHNPTTGESLGLLIEESRTNLQVYSEEFDNGAWTKTRGTITANKIIAPNGTLTADKLVQENGNTSAGVVNDAKTLTLGTDYTFSCYAKAEYYDYIILRHQQGDTKTWFNVSNGTIGTSHANHTASITDVGNGWYRCSISFEMSTSLTRNFSIYLSETDNSQTVTAGTGFNGVYLWGAQIEEGSFPTSYIKTTGSQVTRSGDSAVMTGTNFSDWFNQQESTIYTELAPLITDAENMRNDGIWQLTEEPQIGSSVNANITLNFYQSTGRIRLLNWREDGSSDTVYPSQTYNKDDSIKVVTAFKDSDASLGANGTLTTGTNWRIITTPKAKFEIGLHSSNFIYNGAIKKIAYYPKFLTDNEVTDLSEE